MERLQKVVVLALYACFLTATSAMGQQAQVTLTKVERPLPDPQKDDQAIKDALQTRDPKLLAKKAETPAPQAAKPGEYAQHSARYREYIASCTVEGTNDGLRDEAAHRYEAMSQKDFDQQIEYCQRRFVEEHPRTSDEPPPQRQAYYYGRGGMYYGNNGGGYGGPVTDADYDAVQRLANKYFGPAPGPYLGSGITPAGGPPPGHYGCRVVQVHNDYRGVTRRWWCAH